MPADVKRATRVSERVREEISWVITRDVRDPRAAGVTVTRVEMPDDLKIARVYFTLISGGDDATKRSAALDALGRAAGMLRREVTKRVGLRYAPELRFMFDDMGDRISRIEELLAEIHEEDAGRPTESPAAKEPSEK